jgi:NAD(P)-dependent dehydrogenase (short-subunit alcohol dehydrogenase family)
MTAALAGHHAFITGGGSGIGLACARAFLRDGARVTIMGRSRERLEQAAAGLAALGDVAVRAGDVAQEAEVDAALAAAHAAMPLTIAVANAGTGGIAPLTVTRDDDWQRILRTNLDGTFYTFKHAGRLIGSSVAAAASAAAGAGGALCAISSIAGIRTHRFMHAHCASKAAIDMLVRTTADELGMSGVRVNSVCPGLVDTEIAAGLFATDAVHEDYLQCMPVGRTGEPDDIARAVRFLCGPEASWITGVSLPVDGGHHLRRGPAYEPFIRALYGDDLAEGRL